MIIPKFNIERTIYEQAFADLITRKEWYDANNNEFHKAFRKMYEFNMGFGRRAVSVDDLYRLAAHIVANSTNLCEGEIPAVMSDLSQFTCIEFFREI